MRLRVLLIGDYQQPEFEETLRQLGDETQWRPVASIAAADSLADDFWPDLILVAQTRPGQFLQRDIDRLRHRYPLSRVLGLLGSWCEGETRSGDPWASDWRSYWHEWPAQLRAELRRAQRDVCPQWGKPLTASKYESRPLVDEPPSGAGTVAIYSPDYDMASWLAEACRAAGHVAVCVRDRSTACGSGRLVGATVALWVGVDGRASERARLTELVQTIHPAPVIALMDFPRYDDRQRVLAAGACAVMAKPIIPSDLWEVLARHADLGEGAAGR